MVEGMRTDMISSKSVLRRGVNGGGYLLRWRGRNPTITTIKRIPFKVSTFQGDARERPLQTGGFPKPLWPGLSGLSRP
jgi:hypothetical protein